MPPKFLPKPNFEPWPNPFDVLILKPIWSVCAASYFFSWFDSFEWSWSNSDSKRPRSSFADNDDTSLNFCILSLIFLNLFSISSMRRCSILWTESGTVDWISSSISCIVSLSIISWGTSSSSITNSKLTKSDSRRLLKAFKLRFIYKRLKCVDWLPTLIKMSGHWESRMKTSLRDSRTSLSCRSNSATTLFNKNCVSSVWFLIIFTSSGKEETSLIEFSWLILVFKLMLNIYNYQPIKGSKISTNERIRLKHQFENKPKKTFLDCLEVVAKSFILICLSLNCFFQFACNQKLFFLPSYKMKLWNCDFEITENDFDS